MVVFGCKIASEIFNVPEDSPLRHRAFVVYHLTTLCFKQGHLFIYLEKFFETKIDIDKHKVKIYLKEIIQEKNIDAYFITKNDRSKYFFQSL